MSGSARLAPYPYSVKLAGTGLMLKTDPQTGRMMSSPKVQPFTNVVPQEYNYSTVPPFLEEAYPFRRLIMGMGERVQTFKTIRRYYYADGIDCSINGMPMLALAFETVTPASTGPVMEFVEANMDYGIGSIAGMTVDELAPYTVDGLGGFIVEHDTTAKLLALCGQYVNVRNGDTDVDWVLSKDLGDGVTAQSAQRFKSNVDNESIISERIYVATDNGHLWQFTGETDTTDWTDLTALLPTVTPSAYYLEVNNDLLVRSASPNVISTCSADPAVATNWSGPVFVGDAAAQITFLRTLGNTVFVFKTDGVYDIDSDGNAHNLFPELRVTIQRANGRNAAAWQNLLWFRFGDGFYSLGPNSGGLIEMHPVGPERFIENDSPVRGYVTATAGWAGWFNFFSLYNEELNTSYLMKYGSWYVDDAQPLGSSPYTRSASIYNPISSSGSFFDPTIHGALATFPNKKITSMKVSTLPGPNERLYIGFNDGTISWAILPRGTPNPLADSNCTFQQSGTIEWDGHTMGYPDNTKAYRGVTMNGPIIDAIRTATIGWRITPGETSYRVDDLAIFTVDELDPMTVDDLGGASFTTIGEFTRSGERIDLVNADGTVGGAGISIDLQLTLQGDGTTTPWIEGFALHEMLRPDLLLERDFTAKAEDKITRRDGTQDWRNADQIRAACQAAANAKGVVPLQLEDGRTVQVEVIDYHENLASEQARWGNSWDIDLKCVEFASTINFGTVDRLSGYTVDDLVMTVDQLGDL